jgi:predicted SAM-dependent methyltransferase
VNANLPSGLMAADALAAPGETSRSSVGTSDGATGRSAAPNNAESIIDRLRGVSSDQMAVGRFASQLLFKVQYFVLHRVYSPRPPRHSRLLNLGCGNTRFEGWVNADRLRIAYLLLEIRQVLRGALKLPDWVLDATWRWNCPDDYWEGIFSEDVLEHLSYNEAVAALKEALRTLQPGRWIRIALPDVRRYIEFYNANATNQPANKWFDERFAYGAESIAYLTQNQGHASVWDARLLSEVLAEIGFANVRTVDFERGTDRRLIMERRFGCHESLYVEAQKPAIKTSGLTEGA